jgi:hypothetical protein
MRIFRRTVRTASVNHAKALARARGECGFLFAYPGLRRAELSWIRCYGYQATSVNWYGVGRAVAEVDRADLRHPRHRELSATDVCVVLTLHLELEEVA